MKFSIIIELGSSVAPAKGLQGVWLVISGDLFAPSPASVSRGFNFLAREESLVPQSHLTATFRNFVTGESLRCMV